MHSPGEVVCMPSFDQLGRHWRRLAFHVRLDDIIHMRIEHLCLSWGENILIHSYPRLVNSKVVLFHCRLAHMHDAVGATEAEHFRRLSEMKRRPGSPDING